jgi:RimJ/RimL family protein N-acetyltransferase
VTTSGLHLAALVWPRHTERLLLRPATEGDIEAVLAYRSRADVAEYLNRGPLGRHELAQRIASDNARAQPGHPEPLLRLVMEERGRVIGDAVVRFEPDDNGMWSAVLGYTIHPEQSGRGLATEVARALVALCFTELHVSMVQADVFVPHRASQRVLEKAGLRVIAEVAAGSEGEGRPRLDDRVYAVTAAEWASTAGAPGSREVLRPSLNIARP